MRKLMLASGLAAAAAAPLAAQTPQDDFTRRVASILAMAQYATEAQTCGVLGAPYTLGDVNAAADNAANDAADSIWGADAAGAALTAKMAALHSYYEASAALATKGMYPPAAECRKIANDTSLILSLRAFLHGQ